MYLAGVLESVGALPSSRSSPVRGCRNSVPKILLRIVRGSIFTELYERDLLRLCYFLSTFLQSDRCDYDFTCRAGIAYTVRKFSERFLFQLASLRRHSIMTNAVSPSIHPLPSIFHRCRP